MKLSERVEQLAAAGKTPEEIADIILEEKAEEVDKIRSEYRRIFKTS